MNTWTRRHVFCGAAALSTLPLSFVNKKAAGEAQEPKLSSDAAHTLPGVSSSA